MDNRNNSEKSDFFGNLRNLLSVWHGRPSVERDIDGRRKRRETLNPDGTVKTDFRFDDDNKSNTGIVHVAIILVFIAIAVIALKYLIILLLYLFAFDIFWKTRNKL